MSTPEQEESLRSLAKLLDITLEEIYDRPMGYILLISDYGDKKGIADYISNVERESATSWMKETIGRFENNQIIPATKGEG